MSMTNNVWQETRNNINKGNK